jgi:phosphate transport system substrate-binding protein
MFSLFKRALFLATVFGFPLTSCSKSANEPVSPPQKERATPTPESSSSFTLNGAGATFPYPIYSRWAFEYKKQTGTKINYQSIGSGGGIAQTKARTIDFGASDAPLSPDELQTDNLVQFPLIIGGVVPIVNIDGVPPGVLKLDGEVLANIFLGAVSKWNDPAIVNLNPGLSLPNAEIAVIHRSDSSGTTWIFTNYLNKVSSSWKEKVGNGRAVNWPTGMGGKGNEGVAAYVQRVKGAIGYVEFAYAVQNNISHVQLRNRDGHFVEPTLETFKAAADSANWPANEGFYLVLTDQPGERTWPITGASFILMQQSQEEKRITQKALKFFMWCYENGSEMAKTLHYVPIPKEVVTMVHSLWKEKFSIQVDTLM